MIMIMSSSRTHSRPCHCAVLGLLLCKAPFLAAHFKYGNSVVLIVLLWLFFSTCECEFVCM